MRPPSQGVCGFVEALRAKPEAIGTLRAVDRTDHPQGRTYPRYARGRPVDAPRIVRAMDATREQVGWAFAATSAGWLVGMYFAGGGLASIELAIVSGGGAFLVQGWRASDPVGFARATRRAGLLLAAVAVGALVAAHLVLGPGAAIAGFTIP